MLNFVYSVTYVECHIKTPYGECRYAERNKKAPYAECRYAECHGALQIVHLTLVLSRGKNSSLFMPRASGPKRKKGFV
jgi:hypothetical protein